jgi:hypothetical protein
MIAFDGRAFQFLDAPDAFVRVGVVANDVTQANVMRNGMLGRIRRGGFKSLEVSVDIAENGKAHCRYESAIVGG